MTASDEQRANARLIAAAPDMLAMLKLIASGLARKKIKDASLIPRFEPGATSGDLTSLSVMVDAAIAKAEGR